MPGSHSNIYIYITEYIYIYIYIHRVIIELYNITGIYRHKNPTVTGSLEYTTP